MSPQFWAPDGWAWGIVKIRDHPGLRYGVVSPNGMSAGEIVIMTGHGETAEGWFETARWLVDQDYSVWVLEAAGQGGSGRYGEPRDVAQAPDFTADMDGVRALVAGIIRPKTRNPVSVIASGAAAPAAIAALSHGMPAWALILSAPGDGAFPAGGAGWSRPKSTTGLTVRQREQLGWMIANPDLRMGGAARTWRTAWARLAEETRSPVIRARFAGQVLIVGPRAAAADCAGFRQCETRQIASNVPYQVASDSIVEAWRRAVLDGLMPDHAP